MKKIAVCICLIILLAVTVALASDKPDVSEIPGFLGLKGSSAGCFCCVKETCVVTRNEADCKKIGGIKIKKCEECGKSAEKRK